MEVSSRNMLHVGEGEPSGWRHLLRLGSGAAVVLLLFFGLVGRGVAADAPGEAPPPVNLTVQDKMISAEIVKVPLGSVLTELAKQGNLTIFVTPSDAKRTVSAKFKAIPMLEGIKRLLGGQSYALVTEPTVGADGKPSGMRVAQIRVLSKGEAYTKISGRPSKEEAEIARLKREATEAVEAKTRSEALLALAARRANITEEELAEVVVPAMHDTASEVRATALGLFHTVVGFEEGVGYLADMARRDTDPKLRAEALSFLVAAHLNEADAIGYVREALQDKDPKVRRRAQRLLRTIEEEEEEEKEESPNASPPVQQQ